MRILQISLLILVVIAVFWFAFRTSFAPSLDISKLLLPHEIKLLNSGTQEQREKVIRDAEHRVHKSKIKGKVYLLHVAKDKKISVIAGSNTNEDSSLTGAWPAPWPAVKDTFAKPLTLPIQFSGHYHGKELNHAIVAVNDNQGIYALVNSPLSKGSFWRIPFALCVLILAIALGLKVVRPSA